MHESAKTEDTTMTTLNTATAKTVAFELKDVTVNFPRLGKAWTPRFADGVDGPQWSLQAQGLNEEDAAMLEELGVTLVDTDEGRAVNLKAYTQNSRGEANEFMVYDSELNEMTAEQRETVGYGSKAHVLGYMFVNSHGTVSLRMTDVVVEELVERQPMSRADSVKARLGLS